MASDKTRPTKKQREMLSFIDNFIAGHGYGPSYREIMRGMGYNSVATVSLHVDNLIKKGHLKKRDNKARSLEVVGSEKEFNTGKVKKSDEKWLISKIEHKFHTAERLDDVTQPMVDELYVLIGALKILDFEGAANSFVPRLAKLKQRL